MSHRAIDATWARVPHCSQSSADTVSATNASTARRRFGWARARPSSTSSVKPSSSKSQGRTGSAAPVDRAARETSRRWPQGSTSGPATSDATHAWRYVSRASATFRGSRRFAACSSMTAASRPGRAAHWICPLSSSARAVGCHRRRPPRPEPGARVQRRTHRPARWHTRQPTLAQRAAQALRSGPPNAREILPQRAVRRGPALCPPFARAPPPCRRRVRRSQPRSAMPADRDRFLDSSLQRVPDVPHADRLVRQRCRSPIARGGGESAHANRSRAAALRRPPSLPHVRCRAFAPRRAVLSRRTRLSQSHASPH